MGLGVRTPTQKTVVPKGFVYPEDRPKIGDFKIEKHFTIFPYRIYHYPENSWREGERYPYTHRGWFQTVYVLSRYQSLFIQPHRGVRGHFPRWVALQFVDKKEYEKWVAGDRFVITEWYKEQYELPFIDIEKPIPPPPKIKKKDER